MHSLNHSELTSVHVFRTPAYSFSNLRLQEDTNGITADFESIASSNGTACRQDSNEVRVIADGCLGDYLCSFYEQNLFIYMYLLMLFVFLCSPGSSSLPEDKFSRNY